MRLKVGQTGWVESPQEAVGSMIFDCLQLGHFERHKLVAARFLGPGARRPAKKQGMGRATGSDRLAGGCPLGRLPKADRLGS